ncbi:hypothetical protein SASPL_125794 [Salvia splendens]|uniref:Cytochrome c oxidase subunit 6b n=1 Tax=Salvia splendens TaxID=180675 RepID=A0A8X8XI94_SALSN|nr:hypothetical protein SASPL_125794 [Salvia splendens]
MLRRCVSLGVIRYYHINSEASIYSSLFQNYTIRKSMEISHRRCTPDRDALFTNMVATARPLWLLMVLRWVGDWKLQLVIATIGEYLVVVIVEYLVTIGEYLVVASLPGAFIPSTFPEAVANLNKEINLVIELKTAPADFRFPTTNQTRHCFTRYIEFHRCVAAKGEEDGDCNKFAKYYRSLCPGEWVR